MALAPVPGVGRAPRRAGSFPGLRASGCRPAPCPRRPSAARRGSPAEESGRSESFAIPGAGLVRAAEILVRRWEFAPERVEIEGGRVARDLHWWIEAVHFGPEKVHIVDLM